jgi:hypothetical protein
MNLATIAQKPWSYHNVLGPVSLTGEPEKI